MMKILMPLIMLGAVVFLIWPMVVQKAEEVMIDYDGREAGTGERAMVMIDKQAAMLLILRARE